MIEISNLNMSLSSAGRSVSILDDINLKVPPKEFLAIVGPSGSGKSTLLGLIAGLDQPSSGSIVIDGTALSDLNEDQLATLRREKIGMVFQSFHLIPTMSALENVQIPLELQGVRDAGAEAGLLMTAVGLENRFDHYPVQLSGGEQQRVAVARAYAGSPALLLADEPTGNLDSKNGKRIIDLLLKLHQDQGNTLILVTHDMKLAARADRIITLGDGKIVSETDPR
ncbi:ABC-type antimicrobial peptide transport system, ATPase component [hydrothermal vent metagenome]|uniref:ABC-type antimicrobial peptide transport system, ATPase component n=1 Tax=hydrothermal vent metagenome TaxID=652676 RepID=A0A3B1CUU5_9ZZZZ|nr:ABC transporter ATP-binding protein [Candidatus Manganitrophaceae bacterium]